jgi:hypothetical protein
MGSRTLVGSGLFLLCDGVSPARSWYDLIMVPHSKARKAALVSLLQEVLPSGSFAVLGPNGAGGCCVRCKSTDEVAAIHVAFQLIDAFNTRGIKDFIQTDDTRFRVMLSQFGV